MGFTYEDEELELVYKGVSHKFRTPSAMEQRNLSKSFQASGEDSDALKMYCDFFVSLGLPEDVINKMSMKGILDLFSYTVGAKKN